MFRIPAVAIFLMVFVAAGYAQDTTRTGWATSLILDLTATQTSYSDSWVGGEAGSVNWVSNLNGSAQRRLSPRFNFKSTLKMSFGQTLTQDEESKVWGRPVKSTDLIDWENVGRFTLGGYVDPYVAFRLESQFLDASIKAKKRFFNPVKLTESAGIARMLYELEKNQVITRLGVASRQTITRDIVDTMLNTETNSATDAGLESVTDVTWMFNERLAYTGKLTLYKALLYSKKDDFAGTESEDYWKAVDVNWENIVNASVTKLITVNFYAQFLYDKQVSKHGRLKQTLGIGFVLKLV
ncbi:MAG: DUF3078 domain-containing protein [Candidatus Zixiibacteriota bacterium]|nr:MAG: DUF3078 domain-containing protein [candidate division Zixibacteria bacterium]